MNYKKHVSFFVLLIVLIVLFIPFAKVSGACGGSTNHCPGGYPVPTQPTLPPNCRISNGQLICKPIPTPSPMCGDPSSTNHCPGGYPVPTPSPMCGDPSSTNHCPGGYPVPTQPTLPPYCHVIDGRVICKTFLPEIFIPRSK